MQFLSNALTDISDTIETLPQLALNFCYKRTNMGIEICTIVKHQSNNHCVILKFIVLHMTKKHDFLRTLRKHAQSLPTFVQIKKHRLRCIFYKNLHCYAT